ncbi:hypothetical protein [Bradyrhizobium sp. BR2003]|uniref:hypothetical protein n=1 Tax=Bradyrhizobium sp. BR2003 TaxID=1419258 RepID=UPI001FEFDBEB|nr:hypothetical protein [Bradyrhizobium sp. BR2003]
MSDWLHNLSVPWMAFIVFGFTYLVAILIFAGVAILSTKERATSFKSISPGMCRCSASFSACLSRSPRHRSGVTAIAPPRR